MEPIKLFLKEVTEELLYNIIYHKGEIDYHDFIERFQEETGYRPMDFFGLGNITGCALFDFVRGIPGVAGKKQLSIVNSEDSSDFVQGSSNAKGRKPIPLLRNSFIRDRYSDDGGAYNVFNRTTFDGGFVAKYREMILITCCTILRNNFAGIGKCKDNNGNTPLHYIAALPGVGKGCCSLVKYLLKAGVNPLATNDDRRTFLHIIFGRYKATDDGFGSLCFTNKRVGKTKWFVEDRVQLLELLSKELPEENSAVLAKLQDKDGNTVLHEYAMSTTAQDEVVLYMRLLNFGASYRIQNNSGQVPLHYAHNSSLFKISLQNGAVCYARNDCDETPVLRILKKSVEYAFAQTSASAELENEGFVKITVRCASVKKAVELLRNLKTIISENNEAKKAVWIPDRQDDTAIDFLLIAIRIASYDVLMPSGDIPELLTSLVELLHEMLRNATPRELKRQNKKGQSFLHVLLDMGEENKNKITEEAFILQSIQILLDHQAEVNAIDSKGRTPLDITFKHLDGKLALYKKCADLLIKHGGIEKCNKNESRRLRSCPVRHVESAKRLTNTATKVTVVERKYRYSSQFLIGNGAFSSVFIAIKDEHFDIRSGKIECRAYAIKRLEKAKINPQEIKREITTLLSISDENIIKCHEAVEDPFFQYLCLELMDGDLQEFVSNDSVNRVMKRDSSTHVQIARGIIDGLTYLHEKKFIHRDLKPGNILYATDPKLHFKIADFGLTKNLSTSCTMTSTRGSGVAMAPGTRCWMAPELVSMTSREHTEQSDVFSLGLVLHYLLTLGKHPFASKSEEPAHVIERKIVDMQIHFDPTLHPEASSFLMVLLTKKSSKRPPAAYLKQHPFLWSERKKIEFLKAVGDQPEAEHPSKHVNSDLERRLQTTNTGSRVSIVSWDQAFQTLYDEVINSWRYKKYRTDVVIDLLRFIRNAYNHKQDRSPEPREYLDQYVFLSDYPSLVLDVYGVVRLMGFDEDRDVIRQALSLDT